MTPNQLEYLRDLVSTPDDLEHGWCWSHDQDWLRSIISSLPSDATIVEIGTYRAKSAAVILLACQGSSRRIYTVDPFVDYKHHSGKMASKRFGVDFEELYEETKEALRGLPITMLRRTSELAASEWDSGLIDFLWVDGNHTEEAALQDLVSWFPLIKEGGVIGIHDWGIPSVKLGVRTFLKVNPMEYQVQDGIWWAYKKGENK